VLAAGSDFGDDGSNASNDSDFFQSPHDVYSGTDEYFHKNNTPQSSGTSGQSNHFWDAASRPCADLRKLDRMITEQNETENNDDDEDSLYQPDDSGDESEDAVSNGKDNLQNSCLLPPPTPFIRSPGSKRGHEILLAQVDTRSDIYEWNNGRHRCHHADVDVPSSACIDSSCAVLSYFDGMYFCPLLSAIMCPVHHHLVLLSDLQAHLKKHHKFVMRLIGHMLDSLIGHLQITFSLSFATTPRDLFEKVSNIRLSSPVPGLSKPELCVQCPSCNLWFKSEDDKMPWQCIRAHWGNKVHDRCVTWKQNRPRDSVKLSLPRHYASPLFNPADSRFSNLRVVFVSGYLPASIQAPSITPNEPATQSSSVESPHYLNEFGWIPYVDGLNAEPSELLQLIALPSSRMVAQWPEDSEGFHVEEGLTVLHEFFRLYLQDANTRVNSCHGTVRDALVEEYVRQIC
jgi:hypothetical protein